MISLPRETGGNMRATENHRGAGSTAVGLYSVFERGKPWVSDEQGGLSPGSVFWLFGRKFGQQRPSKCRRRGGTHLRLHEIPQMVGRTGIEG